MAGFRSTLRRHPLLLAVGLACALPAAASCNDGAGAATEAAGAGAPAAAEPMVAPVRRVVPKTPALPAVAGEKSAGKTTSGAATAPHGRTDKGQTQQMQKSGEPSGQRAALRGAGASDAKDN